MIKDESLTPFSGEPSGSGAPLLCAERRRTMIAEAAYFRAQSRGFAPGSELDDWLEAEWSVDEQLAERALGARCVAD